MSRQPAIEMHGILNALECPECSGVLSLHVEGATHARFRCQIGHVFGVDDLIAAKEERLETRLWTVFRSQQELAHLLRTVAETAREDGHGQVEDRFRERAARAARHADEICRIIEESAAVDTTGAGEIKLPGDGR